MLRTVEEKGEREGATDKEAKKKKISKKQKKH
jgi:hypothetical protein